MKACILLTLSAATAFAVGIPAQHHPMGMTAGWDSPSGSLGGTTVAHNPQTMNLPEGDLLNRIDSSDYIGWGLDPLVDPSYGTWCMVGVEFVLEDPDVNTPEFPAWISGWSEDPLNPNFPDVAGFDPLTGGTNFLFAGPVPGSPFGATLWAFTLPQFCQPTGQDIFLGVNIGPLGVGEGVFAHAVADQNVPILNPTLFDNPGPGAATIDEGSYVCVVPTETFLNQPPFPTGDPAVYSSYLSQTRFEVYVENASGGVATAATNQTSYEHSNLANGNGTPNFLSGLHPDASDAPLNVGRNLAPPAGWIGDQIGFIYSDHRLVAGDPVFILVSLSQGTPAVPLNVIPGTGAAPTGLVMVNFLNHLSVGAGFGVAVSDPELSLDYARFEMMLDLPAVSRNWLINNHPTLYWQGFGLDANFNVHATGLVGQHF